MALTVVFGPGGAGCGDGGDGGGVGPADGHHCRFSFLAQAAHAAGVVVALQWLWQRPTCLQC